MINHEFALVAGSWFDGERHHSNGPTTFTIRKGRISDIADGDHGPALLAQGMEVTRGAFLMPGLADAHVHLFLDGVATDGPIRAAHLKQPVEQLLEAARTSAHQSLACGVTLVRDAGDRHGINHQIRDEASIPGSGLCRVHSGGMGIKRPHRYGSFMGVDVKDGVSVAEAVSVQARSSDAIKLILTGIIDFDAGAVTDEPQFTLEETRSVVTVSRAAGRSVFAHCSGAKGLAIAATAGVGSIEHGFFMQRSHLELMLKNHVAWTPTFCPVHFQWAHPEVLGWSAQTVGNLRRILDNHVQHLSMAAEMGVTLLLGTDSGSMGVEHGRAVFSEISRFLEAGLSLEQTLSAATANCRRHFNMQFPTLVRGAPFEALLLAQDPFVKLDALTSPQQIWPAIAT